jgi:hypothetical protein
VSHRGAVSLRARDRGKARQQDCDNTRAATCDAACKADFSFLLRVLGPSRHAPQREIPSEVVEGDRAAVHSRLVVRHKPTGATHTTDVIDLFTFQDGKIIELVEAADNALIKCFGGVLGSPRRLAGWPLVA